jgi:hypothetical protein
MIAMKTQDAVLGVLLFLSSQMAAAAVYKCVQANGSVSFQSFICPVDAQSSTMKHAKPTATTTPPQDTMNHLRAQVGALDQAQQQKTEAAQQAYQAHLKALEQQRRCAQAQQQQGVMSSGRPIYHLNEKGERQYVDDSQRDATAAQVQQQANIDCK